MRVLRLDEHLSPGQISRVTEDIKKQFPGARPLGNSAFIGIGPEIAESSLVGLGYVREVIDDVPRWALASRSLNTPVRPVRVGRDPVGAGAPLLIIAGPCAVEPWDRMAPIAEALARLGVGYMRAGAYKPRTDPYTFQGLEKEGLSILARIKSEFGLKIVTEVMSSDRIDEVAEVADILQVGTRNMYHYAFLKRLGAQHRPVLLKRGMSAGMEELLLSAEYILKGGNPNVILCERGIRTFETATRNTLDLNLVPNVKRHSRLPIVVDPSHGTGVRDLVGPMSLAAVACGADGLEIEVHTDPDRAWSDGHQSITPGALARLLDQIRRLELRTLPGSAHPERKVALQ